MANIEEAIQQKSFPNQNHRAVVNVLYTASWLHAQMSALLKPYDLTHEQFNVLRILRGQHPKPITLKEVTARMIDKNSNTSRIIEKLKIKKLAERNISATDRRNVQLKITRKGLGVLKKIDEVFQAKPHIVGKGLPEPMALQLNNLLDKMREA